MKGVEQLEVARGRQYRSRVAADRARGDTRGGHVATVTGHVVTVRHPPAAEAADPDARRILLGDGETGLAVVEEDVLVDCRRGRGDADPAGDASGGRAVDLQLVVELGAGGGLETDVPARGGLHLAAVGRALEARHGLVDTQRQVRQRRRAPDGRPADAEGAAVGISVLVGAATADDDGGLVIGEVLEGKAQATEFPTKSRAPTSLSAMPLPAGTPRAPSGRWRVIPDPRARCSCPTEPPS
jgi:hypothetical protein